MLEWFLFSLGFYLFFSMPELYALSSVLPNKIRRGWINLVYPNEKENWDTYHSKLMNDFPYYKLLNEEEKSEFLVRLFDFKNRLQLEGRDGLEINEHKQIMLSASITQITFGYRSFRLSEFKKIIVYPEIFHSKYLNADVKGITYATGFIYLSWSDFEEGYADYRNKLNLGLHEFAHALMLEKKSAFETESFETFQNMVQVLTQRKASSQEPDPVFRDYGFRNIHEFWAVNVEVFFEQPVVYRETYPNMYKITSSILKQDMAKRLENYVQHKNVFA